MNKKILIFGGTGAIGFSIAKNLKEQGYNPIIIARNKEDLISKSKEINCSYEICDVLEIDQIKQIDLDKAIIEKDSTKNDKFFLATNDYLLSGGDNMFFLEKNSNVYHLGYPLRDAFIDYIINEEKIESKVDNRFIINE